MRLGWSEELIRTIDADLAVSGSLAGERGGFSELLTSCRETLSAPGGSLPVLQDPENHGCPVRRCELPEGRQGSGQLGDAPEELLR